MSLLYFLYIVCHPPRRHLNVKLRPLELHIYICGIFGVSLIPNLTYLYVFAFLPLLPSVLFNLDYSSKTVSFCPIIGGT